LRVKIVKLSSQELFVFPMVVRRSWLARTTSSFL
jgi:hypothetical protein